jgi:hypothetical protein
VRPNGKSTLFLGSDFFNNPHEYDIDPMTQDDFEQDYFKKVFPR